MELGSYKDMLVSMIYLATIFLVTVSALVNYMRGLEDRFLLNIIILLAFILGFFFFYFSKSQSRSEASMAFMIIASELLLAILVLSEDFHNYTTVFPMLIAFSIWYFYSLKQALWITFIHFMFWIGIYIYGYYTLSNHSILHNATAMLGLALSYMFMTFFGFSYYLATSRYQNKLEKSNLQQKLLLNEIHHRVKNNLNIISSILGIQQMTEEDTRIIELMKKNRLRIDSIAMIHEILYTHKDFGQVNLGIYLGQLLDAIKEMYSKNIEVNINSEEINLPFDMVLKLGIITNELAINSLKYAFVDAEAKIYIDFKLKEEILVYQYRDNGICSHENKEDIWEHANLGLKLIQMMTKQMNASIKLLEAKGLVYEIRVAI